MICLGIEPRMFCTRPHKVLRSFCLSAFAFSDVQIIILLSLVCQGDNLLCRTGDADLLLQQQQPFTCTGGLLAAEAVDLLRQFYASGNPNGKTARLLHMHVCLLSDMKSYRSTSYADWAVL